MTELGVFQMPLDSDKNREKLKKAKEEKLGSQIRTKLHDWAVGQARAGCSSQAALSSNDLKTLYNRNQPLILCCPLVYEIVPSC